MSPVTVALLADRPDLLVPLARIRWQEWSGHAGREDPQWWVEATRREAPLTVVATDDAGEVVGGVGLVPVEHPELADRGPWVVGMIVRPDRRDRAVGANLITHLRRHAADAGIDRFWVATGGRAVTFYRRCGFREVEATHLPNGEQLTLLQDGGRLTDRLRLEPIGPQQATDLYELFHDPAVAEWYGDWTPEQAVAEATRIGRHWQRDGVHKWMAYDRTTGARVGRGGLSRAHVDGRDRLELGWALHGAFWGHGYATEIGRAGLDYAFGELGATEVVSFTETRNQRSRAVMERLGFHHVKDLPMQGDIFALYERSTTIRPCPQ
ncbi:GNAT family N-acetyltransferase [Actinoplanes sp. NPDC024001]|uniref:GNAT family N-acetyltransferase n=1 Tax=Actinoplanes sp. NPDC024001 TaxID=3154598 RepID=UPI0033CFFA93